MAQVQVVSKGMRWSADAAAKAKENHQYIKVGPKSGFLLLSGAPARWKKPETSGEIYVPSLRVAGQPAAIRQLFLSLGVPANVVEQHLAASYNAGNFEAAMGANFNAETDAYYGFKKQRDLVKGATGPTVTLDDLSYFV